uniref:Uncharacterized protein n=1 Tax=Micrurus corallinus TaxID=54390 RepID=A0A2D4F9I3_MICCO
MFHNLQETTKLGIGTSGCIYQEQIWAPSNVSTVKIGNTKNVVLLVHSSIQNFVLPRMPTNFRLYVGREDNIFQTFDFQYHYKIIGSLLLTSLEIVEPKQVGPIVLNV